MSFQALRELPEEPPTLLVNDVEVSPFMVDWRTGRVKQIAPAESIETVARLGSVGELQIELANSASPSGLTVGVYPDSVDRIDPTLPPPITHDCVTEPSCTLENSADSVTATLTDLFPQSPQAVFVVTATYFAESDGTPFANTMVWVLEASR